MKKQPAEEGGTSAAIVDISGILTQGHFEWGIVSETGMVFKDETPESEWQRITQNLCALFEKSDQTHSQCAMMLGDALRFGEEKFGEKYADVIDATRDYMRARGIEQAKNWMWVAGKVPPHLRRINLSFAHHELVAKLDQGEQEEFLKLAEDEAMTVRGLREKIRERHPGKQRAQSQVKHVDTPRSVLQKLIDVSNFLSEKGPEFFDDKKTADKWKAPMEKIHLVFRRKWQTGRATKSKKGKK